VTSLLSSTPRLILYIYCSALTGLFVSTPCPPTSTLFPYTTLFRSRDPVMGRDRAEEAGGDDGVRERGPARVGVAAGDLLPEQRRSEEHTSELQSRFDLVCRLLLEKKNNNYYTAYVMIKGITSMFSE